MLIEWTVVAAFWVPTDYPKCHEIAELTTRSIMEGRQHVHLSTDEAVARSVGARRGLAVILRVRSGEMHRDGHEFFRSENGVWLTATVPAKYLGTRIQESQAASGS